MKNSLMAHVVAFYPDYQRSLQAALALAEAGADFLEVQFPFSDPSADGPAIQNACTKALEAGFTVQKGFDFVRDLSAEVSIPVFIMSYANIVFAPGVERFVEQAKQSGAQGLIIPDLPPGDDEGLYAACSEYGLSCIPVIVPYISEARINEVLAFKPEYIYLALRKGITGEHTVIGPQQEKRIQDLQSRAKVMAGFGIRSGEQAAYLSKLGAVSIAGTVFVNSITQTMDTPDFPQKLKDLAVSIIYP
ncbi:MAG: tryptophan synthase subunit alpha [Spirochaetia bacterium]